MTIGEYIKLTDINTYHKLLKLTTREIQKDKPIILGDSISNLMNHDSYRRVKGRLKQR